MVGKLLTSLMCSFLRGVDKINVPSSPGIYDVAKCSSGAPGVVEAESKMGVEQNTLSG